MKIIQELSENIEDEISDAHKYAKLALEYKDTNQTLAEMYFKLSNEEMGHMQTLHNQVVAIIDDYRKKTGDPPEAMQILYNILHKKHIGDAAAVKGMLSLYKGEK